LFSTFPVVLWVLAMVNTSFLTTFPCCAEYWWVYCGQCLLFSTFPGSVEYWWVYGGQGDYLAESFMFLPECRPIMFRKYPQGAYSSTTIQGAYSSTTVQGACSSTTVQRTHSSTTRQGAYSTTTIQGANRSTAI
jgi:hypothetical protein